MTKPFAVISDIVLVVLVIVGAIWLFASGFYGGGAITNRPLLPLSVDGSRILLILTAVGIVVGLLFAGLRRERTRVEHGEVVRYSLYDRVVHWAIAIGFILAFASAVWILRWFGLEITNDIRPTLYLIHYVGAGLIVTAAAMFATSSRVRGQDALFPRWRDVGPAIARLFGYLGVYGESGAFGMRMPKSWQPGAQATLADLGIKPDPSEGKFLAVEKVFSFTPLAILVVIVVATGLIKSAHYFFEMPSDLIYWTSWVHDVTAQLTIAFVGLHLAAILLVPRNWPGIRSMIFGRMSFRAVEDEFPGWADELRQREPRATPTDGVPAHGTVGD